MPLPETLVELRPMFEAKSKELADIFDLAGETMDLSKLTEGDFAGKSSVEKATVIRKRNEELGEIRKAMEPLIDLEAIAAQNRKALEDAKTPVNPFVHPGGGGDPRGTKIKTVREMLTESKDYKRFQAGDLKTAVIEIPEAEFKTLITLSTINAQTERRPGIVEMALEQRTIADLMLQGTTGVNAIEYYEETTVTNNAAAVAEGGTKPESALGYTLRTDTIRKIATWIPATDEVLRDVPRMQSIIEGRLIYMVKAEEEDQLLNGDGTPPNISGILDRTGLQTQAKGGDPTPDAIYKAMTKVEVNAFADPTAVVIHPNDWQEIRLLRTADGIYIWGSPADAGPERIWGLPIRKTTRIAEGTALVGAFRPHAEVIRRDGITITVSTEHSTYFVENKVAILAEERLTLAVYRPAAFCTVTGI